VDPAALTAVLIAQSGDFFGASRRSASPGMERLQPFQRAKAAVMLPWIRPRSTAICAIRGSL
jgi:hypothetical protein